MYGGSKYARNPPVPSDVRAPLALVCAPIRSRVFAASPQVHMVRDYGRDFH